MDALLTVIPPMLASIQDAGRIGAQAYGVSGCGAMDRAALALGNALLGNDAGAPGLEWLLSDGCFEVLADIVVAFTGADCRPTLDGWLLPSGCAVPLHQGGTLQVSRGSWGMWAMMTVQGGWQGELYMNSRSTDIKLARGGSLAPLTAGYLLAAPPPLPLQRLMLEPSVHGALYANAPIRAVPGPEDDHFQLAGLRAFFGDSYAVDQVSRQGYRLQGAEIRHLKGQDGIITNATPLGAVQVPGSGQPIVLMSDRQPTGGYPKIATVVTADLPRLCQKRPGETLRFIMTPPEHAQVTYRTHMALLQQPPCRKLGSLRHMRMALQDRTYHVSWEETW